MKKELNFQKTDTKLTPNSHTRNLVLRNGVYYFRQMRAGKCILRSLGTNDIFLAKYLLNCILRQNAEINSKKNFSFFSEKVKPQQFYSISTKQKERDMVDMNSNETHKIIDIWNRTTQKSQNQTEITKQNNRVNKMIKLLGTNNTIEAISNNPQILDTLIYKLSKLKHRGKYYSSTTLKEHVKLISKILRLADDEELIRFTNNMKTIMSEAVKKHANEEAKTRQPVSQHNFKVLFQGMKDIKTNNFTRIDATLQTIAEQIKQPELTKKERNNLYAKRRNLVYIKKYPLVIYYTILMMLFTGSRATAITTLRHQDIDLALGIIHINQNKLLVKRGDRREKLKHLKTQESNRKLPIAIVLKKLGIYEFLQSQLISCKNDKGKFIFEKAVKTKLGWKPSYINEAVNAFFEVLGLKNVDEDKMFDCHSMKTTFVSYNYMNIKSDKMIHTITGNKSNSRDILSTHYEQYSMDTTPDAMIDAINSIEYKDMEILFDGDGFIEWQKETNHTPQNQNQQQTNIYKPAQQFIRLDTKRSCLIIGA